MTMQNDTYLNYKIEQEQNGYGYEYYSEERITEKLAGQSEKKKPRYYPSNKQQSFIVNAVTGLPYEWRVGSKDELKLFKMVDTTGKCDSDGFVIRSSKLLPNPNANHLYYDSPEQCMNNLNITLNKTLVDNWKQRFA